MKSIFTRISVAIGTLLITSACVAPQLVRTTPSEPPAQPSAAVAEPVFSADPTPTPTPTPEPISVLGSWTLAGTYDPEKWGWDVDKTKPLPTERIDKASENYTIALKEDTFEDGNSGETYKVSYDE